MLHQHTLLCLGIHVPSQDAILQESSGTNESEEDIAVGTPWTDVLWEVDRVHLEKVGVMQQYMVIWKNKQGASHVYCHVVIL